MVRIVSLSVLLTLIVVLGLTFFKVLAPFILPLFLAAVFAILCQPVYAYFLSRTNHHIRLSAGLTTGAVVAVILVPLSVGTVLASMQLFTVATTLPDRDLGRAVREQTEPLFQFAADFLNARMMSAPAPAPAPVPEEPVAAGVGGDPPGTALLPPASAVDDEPGAPRPAAKHTALADAGTAAAEPRGPPQRLTADDLRNRVHSWFRDSLSKVGGRSLGMAGGTFDFLSDSVVAIGSAALAFVIFAVSLYYFLADGTQLVRATERLIPVHVEYQRQMLNQFSRVVRAVVAATFFAALAQAVATVAALWFLGFDHLVVLFVVSLLMAMIPMMGTWLVWLPCAGYLLYHGHPVQALLLCVYGAAFIGMLDNVVRTYILNTDVKLHPLLALISVLGGLQVMGLWGMFVGPIVASCLHALVKIFNHELTALSSEKFAGLEPAVAATAPLPPHSAPPVMPTPSSPMVAKVDSSRQNGPLDAGDDKPPAPDA